MKPTLNVKQSVYVQPELLEEIREEAKRLGRSISWVLSFSYKHARETIRSIQNPESLL